MKRMVLQNASICSAVPEVPTIRIVEGDPEWDAAYQAWRSMKNPTDSPEWKRGVYLHIEDSHQPTVESQRT